MAFDFDAIYQHFKVKDPLVANHFKKINFDEWFKPLPKTNSEFFLSLCRIIVGQQLSGKAASAIFGKFSNAFTNGLPTPNKVLATEDQLLRDTGLSWAKVKYIKDLAQHFVNKKISFDNLKFLSDEEVITELTQVKGIGRWSAEMYLMFSLHRPNVFAYDDLGLNKGLCLMYKLKNPSKKRIEKIVNNWAPYKSFGAIVMWDCLDNR